MAGCSLSLAHRHTNTFCKAFIPTAGAHFGFEVLFNAVLRVNRYVINPIRIIFFSDQPLFAIGFFGRMEILYGNTNQSSLTPPWKEQKRVERGVRLACAWIDCNVRRGWSVHAILEKVEQCVCMCYA